MRRGKQTKSREHCPSCGSLDPAEVLWPCEHRLNPWHTKSGERGTSEKLPMGRINLTAKDDIGRVREALSLLRTACSDYEPHELVQDVYEQGLDACDVIEAEWVLLSTPTPEGSDEK